MEPSSPPVNPSLPRSALHNRVSMLLAYSPAADIDTSPSSTAMRASQKLRLTIVPRPSFRAIASRSNSTRPPSSTRSVIDPTAPQVLHMTSPTIHSPAIQVTPQERLEALTASPLTPIDHAWVTNADEALHMQTRHQLGTRRSRRPARKRWSALFSRSSFRHRRVRTRATFAAVFGFTLLVTLAIYLGLAATGVGSGLMFHVLFIIFILGLTVIFCHSLLTMCLLILRPKRQRRERSRPSPTPLSATEDLADEKPIPIVMAVDEEEAAGGMISPLSPDDYPAEKPLVIRPPPPVYGVWRDTKRMDPNLVHWAKLPPSPDTPTYEEALQDVQRAIGGHRPPSYVDGVLVEGVARAEERDLRHDSAVHPLERQRMGLLFGEAM